MPKTVTWRAATRPPLGSRVVLVLGAPFFARPPLRFLSALYMDVAGPHDHDFTRPHASETLELDHGRDLRGHVRPEGFNRVVRGGPDRFGLPGFRAAVAKSGHRLESGMNRGRDEFFRHCPLEDSLDPTNAVVDDAP
jgi:hypothetical protein